MSKFTRNFVAVAASIAGVVGIFYFIVSQSVNYLDGVLGRGVGGLAFIAGSAALFVAAIIFATMAMTNATHKSAGNDVVDTVNGLRHPWTQEARNAGYQSRYQGQAYVLEARKDYDRHKLETKRQGRYEAIEDKRRFRQEEYDRKRREEAQRQAAYEAQDAGYWTVDDDVQYVDWEG